MGGKDKPLDSSFILKIADAAKRMFSKPVVHKPPIPLEALQSYCLKYKDSSDTIVRRDIAMCLLAFSGILHFNELTSLYCKYIFIQDTHTTVQITKSNIHVDH